MRYLVIILGMMLLLGTLVGIKAAQISKLIGFGQAAQAAGPPPEAVNTAVAEKQTWERTLTSVGSVVSAKGVMLSSDAAGIVTRLRFDSGDRVKQGEILVELDTDVERAQLGAARARLDLAKTSIERSRKLTEAGIVPQAELDTARSTLDAAQAEVNSLQAQIERKIVRAPFSGRLGIRQVNLGQYLAPGTPIAPLQTTDTVFVDFDLPQREVERIREGMKVRAVASDTGKLLAEGTIVAISPEVAEVTRTVGVRASLPGAKEAVRPGMFVAVEAVLPEAESVVSVPATAISYAPYGNSVFLVENKVNESGVLVTGPEGKPIPIARQQFVKLGARRGDFVAVEKGVEAGQEVVTAGVFKLRNGMPVVVKNEVRPEPQLEPTPENR